MKTFYIRGIVLPVALLLSLSTTAHVAPDFCGTSESASVPNVTNATYFVRWQTSQITAGMTVSPEFQSRSESLQKVFIQATDLWNDRIGSLVTVNWKSASVPMIRVIVLPGDQFEPGVRGTTTTYYGFLTHSIRRVEIRINGEQTDDMLVATAVHEFGHALGIQGHSMIPGDAMSESPQVPARISDHDTDIAQRIYLPRTPEISTEPRLAAADPH